MNKKILIIKNITHENPGLLKSILNENNLQYDLIELDKGETFPNPLDYSALIVLGGPDSANDNTLKMTNELQKIKNAIDSKIPYLGICLGLQTLVKANGGKVIKNDVKEIGFRDPENNFFNINLTDEGKIDPIFKGFNSPLKLFHLHGETVSLGPDMTLLATGKYCKNQVVKVGSNAYGLQGNFELTKSMIEEWISKDPDLKTLKKSELMEDFQIVNSEYEDNIRKIFTNFLQINNLIENPMKII